MYLNFAIKKIYNAFGKSCSPCNFALESTFNNPDCFFFMFPCKRKIYYTFCLAKKFVTKIMRQPAALCCYKKTIVASGQLWVKKTL